MGRSLGLGSSVEGLLRWSGPSTVIGSVIPIVVDAVDGVLWRWAIAHICEERLKGFQPSFADRDPSTSVPREVFAGHSRATINHVRPNLKLTGMRHAMSLGSGDKLLDSQTPAGVGSGKVRGSNQHIRSARTAAMVGWVFRIMGVPLVRQNSQSPMNGSDRKNRLSVVVCHSHILPYFGLGGLVFSKG